MSNFKEKLPLFQSNDVQISNVVNAVLVVRIPYVGLTVQIEYRDVIIQCLS